MWLVWWAYLGFSGWSWVGGEGAQKWRSWLSPQHSGSIATATEVETGFPDWSIQRLQVKEFYCHIWSSLCPFVYSVSHRLPTDHIISFATHSGGSFSVPWREEGSVSLYVFQIIVPLVFLPISYSSVVHEMPNPHIIFYYLLNSSSSDLLGTIYISLLCSSGANCLASDIVTLKINFSTSL